MGDTRLNFDNHAAQLWEQVYGDLSEGQPGMLGSMTSRAEAHVVRLSLMYALLDCSEQIQVEHLRAAIAVWIGIGAAVTRRPLPHRAYGSVHGGSSRLR
jgi:hypothetical protein